MSKSKLQPDLTDFRNLSTSDVKIDATDLNNVSKKVLGEKETRKKLLQHARLVGQEKEMLMVFVKFDKLLRNCTNDKERRDIAKMGAIAAHACLGGGGTLYVDGQLVRKDN